MLPAAKFPEPSLETIVDAVFAEVALTPYVTVLFAESNVSVVNTPTPNLSVSFEVVELNCTVPAELAMTPNPLEPDPEVTILISLPPLKDAVPATNPDSVMFLAVCNVVAVVELPLRLPVMVPETIKDPLIVSLPGTARPEATRKSTFDILYCYLNTVVFNS